MERTFPKKTERKKSLHHILKEEIESAALAAPGRFSPRRLGVNFFNSTVSAASEGGRREKGISVNALEVTSCWKEGMGKISGSVFTASC